MPQTLLAQITPLQSKGITPTTAPQVKIEQLCSFGNTIQGCTCAGSVLADVEGNVWCCQAGQVLVNNEKDTIPSCAATCPQDQVKVGNSCRALCNGSSEECGCTPNQIKQTDKNGKPVCIENQYGNVGIQCTPEQMINGTCSLSVYKTLGIRKSDPNPSPDILINDLILSATFFIGTVATIAIIYAGRRYIRGGATGDGGESSKGQQGITNALIGITLVMFSYVIIRLIQYLAKG